MSKKISAKERAEIHAQVERDIATNINLGYLEVVGHTADGKPQFALTKKGEARVEALMEKATKSPIPK
jgi:hypothetical protein